MREDVNDTRREIGSERADALRRTTSVLALGGSTQSSASAEAGGLLSLFFRIWGFLFLGLSSAGLSLRGGQGGLRTILGRVANSSVEHAEIVVETVLPFRVRELPILPQLIGEGGGMSGRGRRGFVVGFLLILFLLEF